MAHNVIMSSADWAALIGAVVALMGALTAYLQSRAAGNHAATAKQAADVVTNGHTTPNGPAPPDQNH